MTKESTPTYMSKEEAINILIKDSDTNKISDGYHTFGELYEHRITLYILVCRLLFDKGENVWKTNVHSDGSIFPGWFVLGIGVEKGFQITYHLPADKWNECDFAIVLDKAPDYDNHTSQDVLKRLKAI